MRAPITDAWIQADPNPKDARNHGQTWSMNCYDVLRRKWADEDMSMERVCTFMGRSRLSVVSKLQMLRLVTYNQRERQYEPVVDVVPTNETPIIQENTMAANIETKTFINGVDATQLTDAQIFERIAGIEGRIDQLTSIRAQSEKLKKAIADLEADVSALAAYVDAR